MSAFIRRQPARSVDVGTRPGLHGQVLISSGLADMDKLLGGGLPLGSLMLVLEDESSQQHLNLLRYFIAEGVACKHSVCWLLPRPLPGGAAGFLPDLATSSSSGSTSSGGSQQVGTTTQQASSSSKAPAAASSAAQAEQGTGSDAVAAGSQGPELRIAWQYRRYIQTQEKQAEQRAQSAAASSRPSSFKPAATGAKALEAGISREWCHSFDLTKPMGQQLLQGAALQEVHCCCCSSSSSSSSAGQEAAVQPPAASTSQGCEQWGVDSSSSSSSSSEMMHGLQQACESFVNKHKQSGPFPVPVKAPSGIGRVAIQSLGSLDWWLPTSGTSSSSSSLDPESAMLQAVARLRLIIQDSNCAALITCPSRLYSASFQARLQHLCDVVIVLETLADDSEVYQLLPDAASACGLLQVKQLHHGALWRQRRRDDSLYVIRHKRRAIRLAVVEIDPDAEAKQGQQQQQQDQGSKPQQQKSAVAQMCGSGPPAAGNKLLDF